MYTTRVKIVLFGLIALIAFLSLFFVFYSTIEVARGIKEEQFFTVPIVEVTEGKAKIKEEGSYVYKEIEGRRTLTRGDTLQSGTASQVKIYWGNGSMTVLEEKTEVRIEEIREKGVGASMTVLVGEVLHDQLPLLTQEETTLSFGSGSVLSLPVGMVHLMKREEKNMTYEVVKGGGTLIITQGGEGKIDEELFLFSGDTRMIEEKKQATGTGTIVISKAMTQEKRPGISQWVEERKLEKDLLDERYYLLLGQGISIEETSSLWWLKQLKVKEALRTSHGNERVRLLTALLDEAYIRLLIAYREGYGSQKYWEEEMDRYGSLLKDEGQESLYQARMELYLHTLFARVPGDKEYPLKIALTHALYSQDRERYQRLPLLFLYEYPVNEGAQDKEKQKEEALEAWIQQKVTVTPLMSAYLGVLKEHTDNPRAHYLLEEWKRGDTTEEPKNWEEEEIQLRKEIEAQGWKTYEELETLRTRIRRLPPEQRNALLKKLEEMRAKAPLPTS